VVQCTLAATVQNEVCFYRKNQLLLGLLIVLFVVTMVKKGGGVGSKRTSEHLAPLDAFAAAAAAAGVRLGLPSKGLCVLGEARWSSGAVLSERKVTKTWHSRRELEPNLVKVLFSVWAG
jgi:hypothetical protein